MTLLFLLCGVVANSPAALELDHVWVMVQPGAPERAALEAAGLIVAPYVNRHDGQGTASVTIEFDNTFLELLWADSTVPVTPGLERVYQSFRKRMAWRTSGWSPLGVAFRPTGAGPVSVPFPTWSVRAEWMDRGDSLLMLTPRGDSLDPRLWIVGKSSLPSDGPGPREPHYRAHRLGLRILTRARISGPGVGRSPATRWLHSTGAVEFTDGPEWLVELEFDGARQHQIRNYRPGLPLILRW